MKSIIWQISIQTPPLPSHHSPQTLKKAPLIFIVSKIYIIYDIFSFFSFSSFLVLLCLFMTSPQFISLWPRLFFQLKRFVVSILQIWNRTLLDYNLPSWIQGGCRGKSKFLSILPSTVNVENLFQRRLHPYQRISFWGKRYLCIEGSIF